MSHSMPSSTDRTRQARAPHDYIESEAWPGYCEDCMLPPVNGIHVELVSKYNQAVRMNFRDDPFVSAVGALLIPLMDRHVEGDDEPVCDSCASDWPCAIACRVAEVVRNEPGTAR